MNHTIQVVDANREFFYEEVFIKAFEWLAYHCIDE